MMQNYQIVAFGESGLLIILGDEIDFEVNQQVHFLKEWIRNSGIEGVNELIPAYASLLIEFGPYIIDANLIRDRVVEGISQTQQVIYRSNQTIEIPTIYGGEYGPDLEFVASFTKLSASEVIRLHSEVEYTVIMMGFSPGFPYLGGMNPILAVPRLSSPRMRVPAGSVGIAGKQTGIYPSDSAGGWQLIGWTPVKLFNPVSEPHFLLKPGDRLRFQPVSPTTAK
jgi:KipI family sensor histidine kinase inhibitor